MLRKLQSDREIELEVQRELLKKVWDFRSKKDLVDATCNKYKCSKTKVIKMVGIIPSSYYRASSGCKKGNKPSTQTFHNREGIMSQDVVIASVK